MDTTILDALPYKRGKLVLTETHLLVVRGNDVVEQSFAWVHMADVSIANHHSFRHRTLGLLASLALFAFSLAGCDWLLTGDFKGLPRTWGRVG